MVFLISLAFILSKHPNNISAVQPIFNKEMLIPNLEILLIARMNKLKEIWPYQFSSSDEVDTCILRKIEVKKHNNLVNLFPINHMSLLGRLEELHVSYCGSFEMLFNIEMSCVGEIEKHSSNLRHIHIYKLGKLRELWRMKGNLRKIVKWERGGWWWALRAIDSYKDD
ncbi:unnamed protein product [Lactuca virosa]|uniref:Disease resistance protein At4g27190-like leucine-rich repeats domain-containing protein n=1 Tax=Lactuca virosa TaxID=75947 RepID=A0AAU9NAL2_9ASTR|nr:unnamed protein product [Lactuca virosa]